MISTEVLSIGKITQAILAFLYLRYTAIAIPEIMQRNGISRKISLDMVFHTDKIIELTGFLLRKGPVPFYIQVTALAKTSAAGAAAEFALRGMQMKLIIHKNNIIDL